MLACLCCSDDVSGYRRRKVRYVPESKVQSGQSKQTKDAKKPAETKDAKKPAEAKQTKDAKTKKPKKTEADKDYGALWHANPTVNPHTGRAIKVDGPKYKELLLQYGPP